jgi:hypothetical protein
MQELCPLDPEDKGRIMGETDIADVLRRSGWSEDRSVDISADSQALIENGVEVWPELEAFLRQFSGLALHYERSVGPDAAWFGSARAYREAAHPVWALRYGKGIGVRFAPIGCSNSEYLTLYATDDGRFFGGFDPSLAYLGSSPFEMLDALINDHHSPIDWESGE